MSTSNQIRRVGVLVGGAALAAVLGAASPALAAAPQPVATAGAAQTSAGAGHATDPSRDLARLKRLVASLGHESHGKVKVTGALGDDPGEGPGATAEVRTRAGAFLINAWLAYDQPDGVANGAEGCRLDDQSGDRSCTVLLERRTFSVWERTYPGQPGRRELSAAATTRGGGTLMLLITNYTEQPDGQKAVGPTWRQAGISLCDVERAFAATRLTVR